jgi:drug/metabolite transporter (DMT)-like permease
LLFPAAASVTYGLATAITWGAADFAGGLAAKKTSVFKVVLIAHASSLLCVAAVALLSHEPLPPIATHLWGSLSGVAGAVGVLCLYRALAIAKMGTIAPVTGLLTAGLPVIVGAITQGRPRVLQIIGFCLALLAIVLISKPEEFHGLPKGLGLAILAGLSFGFFIVFLKQAGNVSVYWPLVSSRLASTLMMAAVVLAMPGAKPAQAAKFPLAITVLCGVSDSLGNFLLVMATRSGRLDVAAVLSSLYPAATVILAYLVLKERVTRIQNLGIATALIAVPMIAG